VLGINYLGTTLAAGTAAVAASSNAAGVAAPRTATARAPTAEVKVPINISGAALHLTSQADATQPTVLLHLLMLLQPRPALLLLIVVAAAVLLACWLLPLRNLTPPVP